MKNKLNFYQPKQRATHHFRINIIFVNPKHENPTFVWSDNLVLSTGLIMWTGHRINPVDKTKLSCYSSHRRSTTVSLETYPSIHFIVWSTFFPEKEVLSAVGLKGINRNRNRSFNERVWRKKCIKFVPRRNEADYIEIFSKDLDMSRQVRTLKKRTKPSVKFKKNMFRQKRLSCSFN